MCATVSEVTSPLNRLRADALLLLSAFIWGTGFIAMKNANESMGPLLFVGSRFFLSALLLLPLTFYETKKQTVPLNRGDIALATLVGLCLFVGSSLQQIGMITTTATNGGFLTALYVILVPFAGWLLTRERIRPQVLVACVLSIGGARLLTINGQLQSLTMGDVLVLAADVAWAFSITLVSVFLKRTPRPFFLSCVQYGITAVLGVIFGFIFEPVTRQGIVLALPAILYAGLFSGGIAFTLQTVAQRHTPAAEAALILSLESVFAAIAGAILLQDHLTPSAMLGCALILLGVLVVELAPLWQKIAQK